MLLSHDESAAISFCAATVVLAKGDGREYRAVADLKLLKDVMKMHLDGAVSNIQASSNFLVR